MEWTFDHAGPVEADVSVPAGLIEIQPAEAEVTVTLEVQSGRHSDDVLSDATVRLADGHLLVHVPQRRWDPSSVYCRIAMPEGSTLSAKTASADVTCGVGLAAFRGSTASGDVRLPDVTGAVSFKGASGDFACGDVAGALQLSTANGDIDVAGVDGDADVSTASGDIRLGEAAGSVRAKTASGDVRLGRVSSGRVKLDTASGDLWIGVAAGIGAHIDATTVSGELECDLPLQDSSPIDAAVEIICRSVSGDVRVEAAR